MGILQLINQDECGIKMPKSKQNKNICIERESTLPLKTQTSQYTKQESDLNCSKYQETLINNNLAVQEAPSCNCIQMAVSFTFSSPILQ
jgi:hypothetical protein